jgi:5-methylcytosine-specific restriction endonuclease McrA
MGVDVWHLNLYAEGPGNKKILMTKDHIIPACKGGKGTLDNLQPMCAKCNNEVKGNRIDGYERLLFLDAFMKFDRNKRYHVS